MINGRAFIFLFYLLLTACAGEFHPDPIDPRLPVYSEEYNRAAGAFINGTPWRYVDKGGLFDRSFDAYFNPDRQELSFEIRGNYVEGTEVDGASEWVSLSVSLEENIKTIDDLRNKTFVLDGEKSFGGVSFCGNGIGQLYIRHAEERNNGTGDANLSGTFSFTGGSADCGYFEVSHGRFDVYVEVR